MSAASSTRPWHSTETGLRLAKLVSGGLPWQVAPYPVRRGKSCPSMNHWTSRCGRPGMFGLSTGTGLRSLKAGSSRSQMAGCSSTWESASTNWRSCVIAISSSAHQGVVEVLQRRPLPAAPLDDEPAVALEVGQLRAVPADQVAGGLRVPDVVLAVDGEPGEVVVAQAELPAERVGEQLHALGR